MIDVAIDPARIRDRAHALWLLRGCAGGSAERDWLEAERAIVAEEAARLRSPADVAAPPVAAPPVAAPAPPLPAPPRPAVAVAPAPAPAPPPAPTGPEPSERKEMLGLQLAPIGKWKPTWDADAKVAKWENPKFLTGIVIRIVDDKLENVDDLKKAAPMMMQLGSALEKIDEEKKTPKGWYAVVERDKQTEMVYIQKHGSKTLVCSANLTKSLVGGIPKKDALKACETIKVKT